MDIRKTIKGIELDKEGHIAFLRGSGKAKDFKRLYSYADLKVVNTYDIMEYLGIERVCYYNRPRMFDLTKHEPIVVVAMAIFRDSIIFRDMANALLLRNRLKIEELERRIEELEKEKR